MSAVYVCPSKDIACGDNPATWCERCPARTGANAKNASLQDYAEVVAERDQLRARVAELENQEPIGYLDGIDKLAEFMHSKIKLEHEKVKSTTPRDFTIPVYLAPGTAPKAEPSALRKNFEKYALSRGYGVVIHPRRNSDYASSHIQIMWETWQAAHGITPPKEPAK